MASEDRSKRIDAVRSLQSQRDAAERAGPGERLRREIREAFERQDARDRTEDPAAGEEPDPKRPPGS
jgi:hypothetical protein